LHITEVLGEDRYEEVHLCEDCAKKYLIEPQKKAAVPKAGAPTDAAEETPVPAAGPACEACGLTYLEFRNQGRFGCEHDYDAFKAELLPLLESIHGDAKHTGKTPRRLPRTPGAQLELTNLRRRLQQLVTEENYEEAARIRDRIKELENG
jgi:protein arginine kinase activator